MCVLRDQYREIVLISRIIYLIVLIDTFHNQVLVNKWLRKQILMIVIHIGHLIHCPKMIKMIYLTFKNNNTENKQTNNQTFYHSFVHNNFGFFFA